MNDKSEVYNLNKISNEINEMSDLMHDNKSKKKQNKMNNNDINIGNNNSHKLTHEKLKYIETMMKEVLYNSLAQACIKIYQTKHFKLKIFLLMSIIILNCLAFYMVVQSIRSYFDYEVITTSRTIYETPTLFPKVTICNQNMLQTE